MAEAAMTRTAANAAEVVYVLRDDFSPAAIASSLKTLLATRHRPITRHRFTLFDTFDGRVARAGARLTSSVNDGAVTWSWQPSAGGHRLEASASAPVHFAWDLPKGPLQHRLASIVGVRRLLSQVEAEEQGSLLEILNRRAKTVARVRIQTGRARRPESHDSWNPLPTTITVTALRGFEDECARLLPLIESRPGLERSTVGLDAIARRAIGATEPWEAPPVLPEIDPSTPAELGARQIHLANLGVIAANEPGVRADLDVEFLHDFRVAIRRTRSLLGQLKHVFPAPHVQHFAQEFSWLGRLTGAPRDLDVLLLALRVDPPRPPAEDMAGVVSAIGQLREQERRTLIQALDGERYRQLLSEWRTFLHEAAALESMPQNARRPLGQLIAARAWKLCRRIVRLSGAIDGQTTAARLHDVRILAKKLRYLVDAAPPLHAEDRDRVVQMLKRLQRVLGDFNDADIQERRLLECAHTPGALEPTPPARESLQRLAAQRRERREELRQTVLDELARFSAADLRSVCRRAFKRMEKAS
jgi:CHAD domain-containing protein